MNKKMTDHIADKVDFGNGLYSYEMPLDESFTISFDELFNIDDLQKLQDQFSDAFGVASIITHPDGKPITRPSNFSRLCQHVIRCTEKGRLNCMHSDAVLGRHHPEGPVVQPCLSGGLWDAGASITVGGKHLASWLIGQVRSQVQDEVNMRKYAREIGANEDEFMSAFREIPEMSHERFQKVAEMLFTMAGQLSDKAYQNVLQSRFISERIKNQAALQESEERYRTTLYSIGDGVITTDTEGRVKLMNPIAEELTGWTQEEANGKKLEEVFHIINEETRAEVEIPVRRVLREGIIVGLANHTILISRNGIERPIADSGSPIRNVEGEIVGVILVFRDQTEERNAEKALRESEEKFRSIVESSPIGKYQYFLNEIDQLIFIGANPAADRIIGIQHETLMGKTIQEAFPNLVHSDVPEKYKLVASGILGSQHFEIDYSDANIVGCYEVTVYRIGDNRISVDFFDVSERKNAEIALRESEERYRDLFNSIRDSIVVTGHDRKIRNCNRALFELFGYSPDELIGNETSLVYNDMSEFAMLGKKIKENVNSLKFTELISFKKKNGDVFLGETDIYTLRNSFGEINGFVGMIRDVTESKKMEAKLRENEETIRLLFNSTAEGIYGIDLNGNCTFCNLAALKMLGYGHENDVLGRNMHRLIHHSYSDGSIFPEHECKIFNAFKKGVGVHVEDDTLWKSNGTSFRAEYWSYPIARDEKVIGSVVTFLDITDKKQFEDQLRQSESKYRYLFENNPAPMWIYDQETLEFLEVNEAAVNHYGYSHDEFLSMSLKDIRPSEDIDLLMKDVESTFLTYNRAGTWRHKKKNGNIIFVDIVSHEIKFEEKSARIVISTDITERVTTQVEIEKERMLLRTLIDNLPDAIYIKDKLGRKIIANKFDIQNIDLSDETSVLGKTDLELFGGEIGQRGYSDDLEVIRTGNAIINKEEIFGNGKENKRVLLTSKIPLFDAAGKVTGLVGIGKDITAQKDADKTIQKLSKGIEQSPSLVVITDINGNVEYVNPKFSQVTGYSIEEVIGQNPRILKSGKTPPEIYAELWAIITSGGIWRGEFHNRKKNGELYWEWATITSIKNDKGEITNYIAIKEDISLRKQMEAELIEAKDKAEESDRLKSAFLANMSHEIRTPLNSIIGFSELLNDPDFEQQQKTEFIDHIILNGNNLLNIIGDIVDLSKIESGEITIRNSVISVPDFLTDIHSIHHIKVEGKNLQLKCSCPSDYKEIDLKVFADKERLFQIFNNLISNALKFTSEGYIEIGCRKAGQFVEFHVVDTGIGIPPNYHAKIFDRFRQVEASYTRKFGGNGLGLAISKNLIELMGGKIWVESEVGKGATFYFTLPLSNN